MSPSISIRTRAASELQTRWSIALSYKVSPWTTRKCCGNPAFAPQLGAGTPPCNSSSFAFAAPHSLQTVTFSNVSLWGFTPDGLGRYRDYHAPREGLTAGCLSPVRPRCSAVHPSSAEDLLFGETWKALLRSVIALLCPNVRQCSSGHYLGLSQGHKPLGARCRLH